MGELIVLSVGLSTLALKTDSLDPYSRSGFNVVARELHTAWGGGPDLERGYGYVPQS